MYQKDMENLVQFILLILILRNLFFVKFSLTIMINFFNKTKRFDIFNEYEIKKKKPMCYIYVTRL